ncbi:hypothetical protein TNCV_2925061 [Trichonephila clavipes]|nr:hypothetical protein TNCV_2925061 [Trichonephila clavipes]
MTSPAACIPLTVHHKKEHLACSREHLSWTENDWWEEVLFSDESRFRLDIDSRCVFIWREPKSQFQSSNIVEKDHCGQDCMMV